MIRTIDHVQLAIPLGTEAEARQFYVGILGFEELPKPSELVQRGGAWFRSGEATLHVGVDGNFRPAKKAHPALRCTEYEALLTRLKANSVDIVDDGTLFAGRRHCYISDPFGNRIELIEAP